jgi:hypothetical protein
MVSLVQELDVVREFVARAPSRGTLTEAARRHGTSRPTAYRIIGSVLTALRRGGTAGEIRRLEERLQETRRRLEASDQQIGDLRRQLKPDWKRIDRFLVEAAVCPVSLRDATGLVREAFGVEVSHEYVRGIVDAASARARRVLESLAPEKKARLAVGDEIFLGQSPLLVVAEPHSLAVLRVSVESRRDEETWAKILQPMDGIEIFASDLGKGMTAAVEARGWPHQADVFHAVRILTQSWAVEERRCFEAIEEEYAYERRLEKLRDAGEDLRGVATNYALARKKTRHALERWQLTLLGVALIVCTAVLSSVRWQGLLVHQAMHLPMRRTLQLTFIGSFFNLAIPGAVSGDLVKAYYIGRDLESRRARAYGTILFDRLLGVSGLVMVCAAAMLAAALAGAALDASDASEPEGPAGGNKRVDPGALRKGGWSRCFARRRPR